MRTAQIGPDLRLDGGYYWVKQGAAEGGVACTLVADRRTRVMASLLPPFLRDVESFWDFVCQLLTRCQR